MENNKKVLGIHIDGVIRNKFDQFDRIYRKKNIVNPGLVDMNENFEYVKKDTNVAEEQRLEILTNRLIHWPISTYNLRNHYEFENEQAFNKFLFDDYVFEIFGSAGQHPKSMDSANRLQGMGEAFNSYDTVLICPGKDQVVTATLYFLTKSASRIKKMLFTDDPETIWSNCDVVITDSPDLLDNKPSGKKTIKVVREYNTNSEGDMTINELNDCTQQSFDHLFI